MAPPQVGTLGWQDHRHAQLGDARVERVQGRVVDLDAGDVRVEHDPPVAEGDDGALQLRQGVGGALPGQAREADEALWMPGRGLGQAVVGGAGGGDGQVGRQVLRTGHVHAQGADVDGGRVHVAQLALDAVGVPLHDEGLGVPVGEDEAVAFDHGPRPLGIPRQDLRVLVGDDVGLAVYAHGLCATPALRPRDPAGRRPAPRAAPET